MLRSLLWNGCWWCEMLQSIFIPYYWRSNAIHKEWKNYWWLQSLLCNSTISEFLGGTSAVLDHTTDIIRPSCSVDELRKGEKSESQRGRSSPSSPSAFIIPAPSSSFFSPLPSPFFHPVHLHQLSLFSLSPSLHSRQQAAVDVRHELIHNHLSFSWQKIFNSGVKWEGIISTNWKL